MVRITTISFLFFAACGGPDASMGDDDPRPDGHVDEALVNGKPASEFYKQFTHAVAHREVEGAAAFPEQADTRNAYLASVFLMPNNQVVLYYAEGNGTVTATGHSLSIFGSAKKKRTGTWRIDGARLVLDSYMQCDGITFNNRDALHCTLTSPIITTAAQGKAGMFQLGISESSPNDSEYAEYVP